MFLAGVPLFWMLLCGHLLGDFYFQSQTLAEEKRVRLGAVARHCCYYAVCVAAVLLLLRGGCVGRVLLLAAASHAVIDGAKFLCGRWLSRLPAAWVFLGDQALHLITLVLIALWQPLGEAGGRLSAVLGALGCVYGDSALLRLACLFLLLGKPANVCLKVCNPKPEPAAEGQPAPAAEPQPGTEYPGAGAMIGTLERFLTAILFLLEQYGAISVVFAAKTLTRYPKITAVPSFSEYYLIGTLGSLLLAISFTFILFPPM